MTRLIWYSPPRNALPASSSRLAALPLPCFPAEFDVLIACYSLPPFSSLFIVLKDGVFTNKGAVICEKPSEKRWTSGAFCGILYLDLIGIQTKQNRTESDDGESTRTGSVQGEKVSD
jgi:hypothetical protein